LRNGKFKNGMSLVDTMAASLILLVIVIGTLNYRYYAVLDIQKAHRHLDAVELTTFMNNAWKGVDGTETFDPAVTFVDEMNITIGKGDSIETPGGYTLLNKYDVVSDGGTYNLIMSYKDIDAHLRELNSMVSWSFGGENNKTFQLTTFVYKE
jgi:hypothetical protein